MKVSVLMNLAAVAMIGIVTGCELGGGGGGGGGGDLGNIGDNNPNLYVALGDSTTDGNNGGGDPYPPRLAAMTGKTVNNMAAQDESSGAALSKVAGVLSGQKPAAVLFQLGAVDLIGGRSIDSIIANLRSIIQQCKANKTVPVVATLQPMIGIHSRWSQVTKDLNNQIRALASSEGARLADVEAKFGDGAGLILGDGLHPNEEGNQRMAEAFKDVL
ncbi:MAG: GDSL-type esterase/lipase family protein [bacterium]